MTIRKGLAAAIKEIRTSRNLTQEDFSDVSSRTYISTLERGMKSPTLDKINEISQSMKVHPMTLLALSFCREDSVSISQLCAKIKYELAELGVEK